ncbi:MAG: lipoyl(octanoyl) transferase LipB [Pseudomonadota bacterium]
MRRVELIDLGRTGYAETFAAMQRYTDARTADTIDQCWLTEHDPVFTQGQAGRAEHLLAPGDIPVVQSDRGGQVTYHGPGQLVGYLLLDLRRLGIGVKALVSGIEDALIALLAQCDVEAERRLGAPGVYVGNAKIAALGLRVRRGCSYHGLSLNVDMALEPFARINPCGLTDIQVTSMRALLGDRTPSMGWIKSTLAAQLSRSYDIPFVASQSAENPLPPFSPQGENALPAARET